MLRCLDLFSGIGGISLGLESTGGFRTVAFCEIEPFCREVLAARWPEVPIHDDVRSLTAQSVGHIDAIVGGFPCQPHSVAGKRKGREDERHLWPEFARLVREIRPRWVLAENVPGIRSTAADEVLEDLEAAGYAIWPLVVGADDAGAPHRRKRVWFVAHRQPSDVGRVPARPREARSSELGRLPGGPPWERTITPSGAGARLAHRNVDGLGGQRSGSLLDGERATQRDDADGRGAGPVGESDRQSRIRPEAPRHNETSRRWDRDTGAPVGESAGAGLEGQRADAGEPAQLQPRSPGARWPARPGEPQHEWEEPRLVYAPSARRSHPEVSGGDSPTAGAGPRMLESERGGAGVADRAREPLRGTGQPRKDANPGSAEQPLGSAAHGLPERLVRRANREALRAVGNSVVPQVVAAIGQAILAAEAAMTARPLAASPEEIA